MCVCVCVYLMCIVEEFENIASVFLCESAFDAEVHPRRLHKQPQLSRVHSISLCVCVCADLQ